MTRSFVAEHFREMFEGYDGEVVNVNPEIEYEALSLALQRDNSGIAPGKPWGAAAMERPDLGDLRKNTNVFVLGKPGNASKMRFFCNDDFDFELVPDYALLLKVDDGGCVFDFYGQEAAFSSQIARKLKKGWKRKAEFK